MNFELFCSKVTGASHIRQSHPCQDSYGLTQMSDLGIVVVADGHGSATHGDIGSALAVKVCLDQLLSFALTFSNEDLSLALAAQFAEHPLKRNIIREWRQAILSHAQTEDISLMNYGTTVLFALNTPRFLLLGQLGDGDILWIENGSDVVSPMPYESLNFANTTVSLCLDQAEHLMHIRLLPPPTRESLLILTTDGYSDSYLEQRHFEKIASDYLTLIQTKGFSFVTSQIPSFLKKMTEEGSGDDISLACIYWKAEPAPNKEPMTVSESSETNHLDTEVFDLDDPTEEIETTHTEENA